MGLADSRDWPMLERQHLQARIEELEAENERLRPELEDDTLIVSLMSDSSDEVFATLELTREEHSQLLRIGIMELIKLGMKRDGVS